MNEDQVFAKCCADVYSHPLVVELLDGIFHPGGLALSRLMAERMGVTHNSRILDIACGDGNTATYLAKVFSCRVAGIDAGEDMITKARERSVNIGVDALTDFRIGYATEIPYEPSTFTTAYSECALCTFTDKEQSVSEIYRVLDSPGVIGINDVVVEDYDKLPELLKGLFGRVACIADALSHTGYIDLFANHRFKLFYSSEHTELLQDMVEKSESRAHLIKKLGKADFNASTIDEAISIIQQVKEQIRIGNIGYEMFIFQK
ncbi:MAG: class I SAM-dependent methyltransferase [Candidatus Thorarchaeota archaeon]|jgi:ubiquinone/menaquinone biosynthesis C-methylase UbiE